jgi:NAD(P)-dependent dehydrogenase (short-subunit alcohol dehydrogenase family)
MKKVIVVTGASSGFGALASRALAIAGHIVYAGMRDTKGRNAPQVALAHEYAAKNGVDLRTVELDVVSDSSVDAGIGRVIAENGRLDVIVHNAGHMVFGPAEAFTPEQFAELYDVNVLSTQRVNRAALPQLRKAGEGASGLGFQQQLSRRHTTVSRSLFRREGRHGRTGRHLCAGADAMGY